MKIKMVVELEVNQDHLERAINEGWNRNDVLGELESIMNDYETNRIDSCEVINCEILGDSK